MKIYTSYFGNMRAFAKKGIVAISIARYSPRWYRGVRYTEVAPTSYMLSDSCSHEEYLREYDEILYNLNADEVVNKIKVLSQGKDVALCCYEKPEDFCHRHLLAEWLTKNGYEVKEWEKENEEKQVMLFDDCEQAKKI